MAPLAMLPMLLSPSLRCCSPPSFVPGLGPAAAAAAAAAEGLKKLVSEAWPFAGLAFSEAICFSLPSNTRSNAADRKPPFLPPAPPAVPLLLRDAADVTVTVWHCRKAQLQRHGLALAHDR